MVQNSKQLVWRCRRGVRELDVLFGRFLETEYAQLNEQEKEVFERFLEVQDPIIMDWLFRRAQPDLDEYKPIVSRLRDISGLDSSD